MYQKVSVESVPLTLELAQQFSGMTPLPGERLPQTKRRKYLETQLLRGKFVGPTWAVGLCRQDGQTYRLDGQHSSGLLASLPEGAIFPTGLLVTITHYEFDMREVAEVFDLFDNPRSARNNQDLIGTYQAQVPSLEGYSREFLIDVVDGLYEHERNVVVKDPVKDPEPVKLPARGRGMYFSWPGRPDFLQATHWLAEFRERKNSSFLHRSVIVGDMLNSWYADPVAASAFWSLVFSEAHPDPDHASRLLAQWYRETLAIAKAPKLDLESFRRKARRMWKTYQQTEKVAAA